MYLSVRFDGEEVQGYPLWDGDDSFNRQSEGNAMDFAYEAKQRHPESHVAIHIMNEAPKDVRCTKCGSTDLLFGVSEDDVEDGTFVCENCNHEGTTKEENMEAEQIQSTVVVTDEEVAAGAKRIQHGLTEWEQGRMTSPDQRDYVIDCCVVLGIDHNDHEDVVREIADEIFEDAGEELVTVESIAKYALTRLKEYYLPEEPKQEFLVHLNIQTLRERGFVDVDTVRREIQGALEVGLGSEHTPSLQGAEVEIAMAEEIG